MKIVCLIFCFTMKILRDVLLTRPLDAFSVDINDRNNENQNNKNKGWKRRADEIIMKRVRRAKFRTTDHYSFFSFLGPKCDRKRASFLSINAINEKFYFVQFSIFIFIEFHPDIFVLFDFRLLKEIHQKTYRNYLIYL